MTVQTQDTGRIYAPPSVQQEVREDGTQWLRSGLPFDENYARCVGDWLEHWAKTTPEQLFLAQRDASGEWQKLSYGEVRQQVVALATWLLTQNLSAERPVVILSDNSIEHALLMLAALHIGVPSCAISQGYSLLSQDHAKLKENIKLLNPGVIYADPIDHFVPALNHIAGLHHGIVLAGGKSAVLPEGAIRLAEALTATDEAAVLAAFEQVTPDTIAKFLFTSGSTGVPKAVINTQRMLCSNQQAKVQAWPFLRIEKPVLVDWLPWSHTFGSNHNFNMVLAWGGTLYIDEGKPAPGLLAKTVNNLREISPTVYFSVPRAYDMLVPLLREDQLLRENFFRNLRYIFYAGAALPQHLWTAMQELAASVPGCETMLVSSWGSTETAPMATDCHFQAERSGVVGIPVPGTTLKLVPNAGKLEVRVKGPNVFPGYWKNPEATAQAFDTDGFYKIGDAMKFVDPQHPELGLLFDGRVSEDFKLLTGTWVHVGALRVAGIDALKPVAQDIVVTGHDRNAVGFLVFPNLPECRRLCPELPADATVETVLTHPAVRQCVQQGLRALHAQGTGSSMFALKALLMAEPPSVEAGEITDKGYLNQRLVLSRRAELVNALYAEQPDQQVISLTLAG
ncbi:feruloyl-CoA synthase [Thiothrix eikelboomii]|uniref:feruloyl-CoA synthase n=1 Tax=Thiothrix eikelboomii TaxID=92487 RepID=UPI003BAF3E2C